MAGEIIHSGEPFLQDTDWSHEDDDLNPWEAYELVKETNDADTLVHLVVEEEHYPSEIRQVAAEKLIKMCENGRKGGVTLNHLACVGDHADEPYKSRANKIISDNL